MNYGQWKCHSNASNLPLQSCCWLAGCPMNPFCIYLTSQQASNSSKSSSFVSNRRVAHDWALSLNSIRWMVKSSHKLDIWSIRIIIGNPISWPWEHDHHVDSTVQLMNAFLPKRVRKFNFFSYHYLSLLFGLFPLEPKLVKMPQGDNKLWDRSFFSELCTYLFTEKANKKSTISYLNKKVFCDSISTIFSSQQQPQRLNGNGHRKRRF